MRTYQDTRQMAKELGNMSGHVMDPKLRLEISDHCADLLGINALLHRLGVSKNLVPYARRPLNFNAHFR
jgi:hypothetical protein